MSCNCNQANMAAIITPVLAAGSTTSPYYWQVNISQRLCSKTCAASTPIFNPTFSLVGFAAVGTNQYMATIQVEGVISYVPCGGSPCCMQSQLISQNFSIPFYSVNVPSSVTIGKGVTVNSVYAPACQSCSRSFVSETPITVTVA